MIIARPYYLDKLIAGQHTDQVKIVTGVRRCGKSFLVFNIFRNYLIESGVPSDHIIEVVFDLYENKPLRKADTLFAYVDERIVDDDRYYLLLDEVQLLEDFVDILNSFIHRPNVDVYATGSNARFLSKDVVTEFRGRGDEIHLAPLSFSEFMSVFKGNQYDGLVEYMAYGGLPAVVLRTTEEEKTDYLLNIFSEIYIRDIVERNGVRNPGDLEELLDVLASGIGGLTNPLKISKTFKSEKHSDLSPATVERYIEYFIDSFLIERARRYDIKGRKYIGTPQKYYFSDVGLRNARMNFRQVESSHLMENIIYNELRARGYSVDVGVVNANTRNKNGTYRKTQLEVDFVCNLASKRYYIQSAYTIPDTEKLAQEQASLLDIDDSFKKIIIVNEGMKAHYNEKGILMMNIYDFLLDADSLSF